MKVVIAFVVSLGAVTALGSGPYLPSGWRPSGPSFLLPTEIKKALAEEQKQEVISVPSSETPLEAIEETEASGSDFLREYGPPQVQDIFKSITVQALPDLDTEKPFAVIETRANLEAVNTEDATAVVKDVIGNVEETKTTLEPVTLITEEKDVVSSTVVIEQSGDSSTTEALPSVVTADGSTAAELASEERLTTQSIIEDDTTKILSLSENTDDESQINERGSLEYLPPADNEVQGGDDDALKVKSNLSSQVDSSLEYLPPIDEEKIEQAIPLAEAKLDTDAQVAIAANLEYLPPVQAVEGKSSSDVSVDIIKESVDESKASDSVVENNEESINVEVEESSGSAPVAKENELLGFKEYGPPKSVAEEKPGDERIENNETRKRRFSSKLVRKL